MGTNHQNSLENIARVHPINECQFLEEHPSQGIPMLYIASGELSTG